MSRKPVAPMRARRAHVAGSFYPAEPKALARLEKSRSGHSPEEIAAEEGVTLETVERSLNQANSQELLEARTRIERKNNQLRQRVQGELSDAFIAGLKKLLEGKKQVILVVGGEVVVREIDDPKTLLSGLNEYMKAVVMVEKPSPALATVINVQQTNSSRPPDKMEEHIAQIRKRQLEGHRRAGLIDVESTKPEEITLERGE